MAKPSEPKGVIFCTSSPAHSRKMIQNLVGRFPDLEWTIYVREGDRPALADLLDGHEVRYDKPEKGRLSFVRAARKTRYRIAAAAWEGDPSRNGIKLVHLLSRAEHKIIFNPDGHDFLLDLSDDPIWLKHARWRLAERRAGKGGHALQSLYRQTLGRVFGGALTLARLAWLRVT